MSQADRSRFHWHTFSATATQALNSWKSISTAHRLLHKHIKRKCIIGKQKKARKRQAYYGRAATRNGLWSQRDQARFAGLLYLMRISNRKPREVIAAKASPGSGLQYRLVARTRQGAQAKAQVVVSAGAQVEIRCCSRSGDPLDSDPLHGSVVLTGEAAALDLSIHHFAGLGTGLIASYVDITTTWLAGIRQCVHCFARAPRNT